MTNVPYGTIALNKVDADNVAQFVPGSVYAVYKDVNENGTYEADIDTFVSNLNDNNGVYTLENVEYGKYLVKEIEAPEGYLVDVNYFAISIDGAGVVKMVSNTEDGDNFTEQPVKGCVEIVKVDEDYPDVRLSGAEFTVYAADKTTVIGKLVEVEKGVYRLDGLRYGEYYVKETKAPEYFVIDDNYYYFEIVNNGETVNVSNDEIGVGTFINSPQKGEIKIVKTSYNGVVEGFSFMITGNTYTGQYYQETFITDANGEIVISNLRPGEYTVHEVNNDAAIGYVLPDDKVLTIDHDGMTAIAKMYNGKVDNPPTGDSSNDGLMQSFIFISAAVILGTGAVILIPVRQRKKQR